VRNAGRFAALGDVRLWLMALALACAAIGIVPPRIERERLRLDVVFVVDITGSMTVRDYKQDDKPQSRLDFVKRKLIGLLAQMPCGSRAGLAIFSERRSFLLLAPVESCENFAPVAKTISELDWRMAWEGDSHIAAGVYRSIDLAKSLGADLVFLSDGQESPPLPYSGGPAFEGVPGQVHGLLVGVGGYALSPIPKFDEFGLETGFLLESDVPQESRFGPPPPGVELRRGYNPRNAPFGADMPHGNENLSSVREQYLQSLATKTGLGYVHLAQDSNLFDAIVHRAAPRYKRVTVNLAPWLAASGLLAFTGVYLLAPLHRARRALRPARERAPENSFLSVLPSIRRTA
jgi:mxaL protein